MSNPTAARTDRLQANARPCPGADHRITLAFRISLLFKAVLAVSQTLAGAALGLAPPGAMPAFVAFMTRHEFSEDPTDPLASRIMHWAASMDADQLRFYVIYLLGHGVLHLVVVASLLLRWRIAYPFSLLTLCVFVIYQGWRYVLAPDPMLVFLTAIDIFVIFIVVAEHRQSTPCPPLSKDIP